MSNQGFIENSILCCDRENSVETKANNFENNSEWTNSLGGTVILDAGDRISVDTAFINERGCGNAANVEIKGVDLGTSKTFNYVTTSQESDRSNLPTSMTFTRASETKKLRDDQANIVLNYYKNMNGTGYIGLPRVDITEQLTILGRKSENNNTGDGVDSPAEQWQGKDNDVEPSGTSFKPTVFDEQLIIKGDKYRTTFNTEEFDKPIYRIRNDNSKYTIFVREGLNKFRITESTGNGDPPNNWTVAPEYRTYLLYRELKTIKINKGFNSATFIANEITRQLQKETSSYTIKNMGSSDQRDSPEHTDTLQPISAANVVESETYKLFPAANNYMFDSSGALTKPPTETTWYNAFSCIAIKRPELYEKGRDINMVTSYDGVNYSTINSGLNGTYILNQYNNTNNEKMVLNILYTKENCDKLRDFFIAQESYPEIWDSWSNKDPNQSFFSHYDSSDNFDNTRFLHMNRWENEKLIEIASNTNFFYNQENTGLGSSEYRAPTVLSDALAVGARFSCLFLIRFNSETRDLFLDNPSIINGLTYGCIGKTTMNAVDSANGAPDGVTQDFITVFPNEIKFDGSYMKLPEPITANQTQDTLFGYKVGFDLHWTAMTTNAVSLYNGMRTFPNYYGDGSNEALKVNTYGSPTTLPETDAQPFLYNIFRYCGADNPQLKFDGSHFSFSDLHTCENVGNTVVNDATIVAPTINDRFATFPVFAEQTGTQSTAQTDIIYKINPVQDMTEFCPAITPYTLSTPAFFTGNSSGAGTGTGENANIGKQGDFFIRPFNQNYEAYTPYDSKSGIFFEDMGYTEDVWNNSLWGLLGFSYEQFNNSDPINRLQRINRQNVNKLKYITTNADIVVSDTKNYATNDTGVPYFTDNLPTQYQLALFKKDAKETKATETQPVLTMYPSLNIKTTSIDLVAQNFPASMIRSYYTIRSSIIEYPIATAGIHNINNMPIVAIVNKENPQNDFYFGGSDSRVFTITKPTRFSSVKVSIHDPDGSYSNVSPSSSVIFKIQKQINSSYNIVDEILQNNKK